MKGKKERSKLEGGRKREGMRKRRRKVRTKREEEGGKQGKLIRRKIGAKEEKEAV